MAELQEVVTSIGHAEVATYIQSGNVLFTPRLAGSATAGQADTAALAAELEQAITERTGMRARAVVLSSLAQMAGAHRLYEGLGFVRVPHRDWSPHPGVDLVAYSLEL